MEQDSPLLDAGFKSQWIKRTLPTLQYETTAVLATLGVVSLTVAIATLLRVRGCRKQLDANPSDHVELMAKSNKTIHKSCKTLFFVANLYLWHSLAIWLVDAVIGLLFVYDDVQSNPDDYNAYVWVDIATKTIMFLASLMAVFVIFPMLQMVIVARLAKGTLRKSRDGSLSAFVPEGRIIASHLAQLWTMLGFCVMALWPVVSSYPALRLIALEAIFGSSLAWLHASYIFNFRADLIDNYEIRPVRATDKLYGKLALYSEQSALLPKYEQPQNEKAAL